MKLIDVLNMISKGELEEGTRVVWDEEIYVFDGKDSLERTDGFDLWSESYMGNLNENVVVIPPELLVDEYKEEEYIEPETKKIEKLNENDLFITLDGITKLEPKKALMRMLDKINELIERMNELCGEK